MPEAFKNKLKQLLGDEFERFLASYDDARLYGLRVNTLKISADDFLKLSGMELKPIPWAPTGFYYEEAARPGKHPHYHAGLYYIQEPSAMAPAELLDVRPGDRVLDLCAAPGGKSTQIAAKLNGQGMLVTNDIHSDRVKALVKNIDLSGVRNAVVLNEQPERLLGACRAFFDKILIDAPCSGEGMFRKEEDMINDWNPDSPHKYAAMQREILGQAAVMLKPGGRMVYSTCTFSPEENEAMIAEFLAGHPDFHVVPVPAEYGFRSGRPDWVQQAAGETGGTIDIPQRSRGLADVEDGTTGQAVLEVAGTVRLWPHHLAGEGHYVAVLAHMGGGTASTAERAETIAVVPEKPVREKAREASMKLRKQRQGKDKPAAKRTEAVDLQPFYDFMRELAPEVSIPHITLHGEHVYASPEGMPDWTGIRVTRPGWYLGSLRKQRFEPSQALAMGLKLEECSRWISLPLNDASALRYLKGETLAVSEDQLQGSAAGQKPKGYCIVAIDGYPVGWGKWMDGTLKNEYQAGWRWI